MVPDYFRHYLVYEIKIYGVFHVIGPELVSVACLIQHIILENLHHDVKDSCIFICVESNSELLARAALSTALVSCGSLLCLFLHVLIFKDMIEDALKQSKRLVENDIAELRASENTIFHLFQFDILEAKDFLCVVICNCCTLHSSNLHLHYVLQEATTDKVKELSFKARVLAFAFNYAVVEEVYIVADVVTKRSSCTCLQLEHNWVAIFILASTVNLRSQEHLAHHHVSEVVLFS